VLVRKKDLTNVIEKARETLRQHAQFMEANGREYVGPRITPFAPCATLVRLVRLCVQRGQLLSLDGPPLR
jgi:hypothetical protein